MSEFTAGNSSDSAEFVVDFSEAQEFEVLPKDWYEVEISEVTLAESSGGNPMLQVILSITEGLHEGRKVFVNWMLTGKGTGITKGALRAALGSVPESGQALSTDDLLGARMRVRITPKVWKVEDDGDGELRNRVSTYRPPTSVGL